MKVKRKFSAQDPGVVRAASGTFLSQVDRGMWLRDFGNLTLRPCAYLHNKPASQNHRMDWKLVTFEPEGFSPQEDISRNPHPFAFCLSGICSESCMQEELGRSMDLGENWSLEEGSWLSHTGAQLFPNTRAGMATLHGPDSHGLSHSCPSLCQPVCAPRLPRMVGYSRAAGWSLLSWDLEVKQTYVEIPEAFIVTYVTIRNTIALGETRTKNSCRVQMGTNSDSQWVVIS